MVQDAGRGAADLIESPLGGSTAAPSFVHGVLQQAFIDGLVFGVPDASGAHFWSSGAHLFPNLRRPGAQDGPRWNFVRHRGQPQGKFFTALATFCIFLGPGRTPEIDQKSILGPKRDARKRCFIDFCHGKRFSHFWARFLIDF